MRLEDELEKRKQEIAEYDKKAKATAEFLKKEIAKADADKDYIGKGKVLIIEDEEDVAKPLYSILNEKGHHYKLVKDGKEALEIIPLYEPDMAIVDNSLPVLSGQEVIYNIRENPEFKDYSDLYLITTGQGFSKEALEMCNDSISKPIDLYEFVNAIEKATSHNRN